MQRNTIAAAAVIIGAVLAAGTAAGQTKVTFALNWVAGGDHAPYFHAQKQGLYKRAGLDVAFEQGRGSAEAAQKVGAGTSQMGLADMGTVLLALGKGGDMVGVLNVYANSPQGLYWLKSSGIKTVKDLAGKKIGNPAGDAARAMWPAMAKAQGMDPQSVTWVNVAANAKLAALKAKSIDATTSFFNIHHIFQKELGDDMGFQAWKDAGVNPYGNTVVANGAFLAANKKAVADFVNVTRQAFAACVKDPKPCVTALSEANSALNFESELVNWSLVEKLMSDEISRTVALGWLDDKRMAADYELVKIYLGIEKPFDVKKAYSNEFLDKSIKMTK